MTTFIDEDPITPVSIEHLCEEIFEDGELEQRYNYLSYVFERDGVRLLARAYLDTAWTVSLFPPHHVEGPADQFVEAPKMREDAIAYFKRRYGEIKELSLTAGYVVIWSGADENG